MFKWIMDRWEWCEKGTAIMILLTVLLAAVIGLVLFGSIQNAKIEQREFMSYCTSKGDSDEDCHWRWRFANNRRFIR